MQTKEKHEDDHPEYEVICMAKESVMLGEDRNDFERKYVWIADSGASTHMSNQFHGYYGYWGTNNKALFATETSEGLSLLTGIWKGRK